jgi:hypothetical protein
MSIDVSKDYVASIFRENNNDTRSDLERRLENSTLLAACLGTCFLLELSFDPEDGGDVIL